MSGEPSSVAPFARCSVILLFSEIGATTNVPSGTSTVPPPLPAEQSSTAFCTAAVSLVVPSPLAPYFFTSQTLPAAKALCAVTPPAKPTTTIAKRIFVILPPAQTSALNNQQQNPTPNWSYHA